MRTSTIKQIEIIVSPNGQTRVETKGFQGGECRDASRLIEQALGQAKAEQLTAEFYIQAHSDARARESQ